MDYLTTGETALIDDMRKMVITTERYIEVGIYFEVMRGASDKSPRNKHPHPDFVFNSFMGRLTRVYHSGATFGDFIDSLLLDAKTIMTFWAEKNCEPQGDDLRTCGFCFQDVYPFEGTMTCADAYVEWCKLPIAQQMALAIWQVWRCVFCAFRNDKSDFGKTMNQSIRGMSPFEFTLFLPQSARIFLDTECGPGGSSDGDFTAKQDAKFNEFFNANPMPHTLSQIMKKVDGRYLLSF